MKKLFQSLSTKLTCSIGLALVISLVIFTYRDLKKFENVFLEEARKKALDITDTVMKSIEYPMLDGEMEDVQAILERVNALKDLRIIHLCDPDGVIKYSGTFKRIGKKTKSEITLKVLRDYTPAKGVETWLGEAKVFRYAVPIMNEKACYKCHGSKKKVLGVLTIGFDWNPVEEKLRIHRNNLIINLFISTMLLIGLITGLLHYMVIIPVQRLTKAAKAIAKGNLGQEIPVTKSKDEVGELTFAFREMQASLIKLTTDLKASSEELKKMYDFQKKLIENSIDGIVATDEKRNIVIFNERAEAIFGYSQEEVVGKMKIDELYPPGVSKKIERVLYDDNFGGRGRLANYETVIINKKGEQVPVWLSAALIHGENGKEIGTVVVFRDLTERKELEEKILQSERLATIGRGVSYIGHEIKNPLIIIGGFTQQVLYSTKDEKNRQKLQIVLEEIERLNQFLTSISDFTKFTKPQLSISNINDIVNEVHNLIELELKDKQIKFVKSLDPHIPESLLDIKQIKQVLLNIIKNSIEAMPGGGNLTVITTLKNDHILIKIKDTGKGISAENLKKIFDPFFTTKPKGSGLGLAISKKIIEAHKGKIFFESELGKGTTCVISIPIER
ncbi:MAG: PAS domain S-box protein [Candidatus Desulfofervidus auxilii]|nr:PAS domain S-box protein [Candidatus Desulfofervidus auxilii]